MKKSHVTKKNPARKKRTTKKKDHLWIIFLCRGRSISFVNFGTKSSFGFTSQKGKATLFQTKTEAMRVARSAANSARGKAGFVGIANASTTPAEIKKGCRTPGKK